MQNFYNGNGGSFEFFSPNKHEQAMIKKLHILILDYQISDSKYRYYHSIKIREMINSLKGTNMFTTSRFFSKAYLLLERCESALQRVGVLLNKSKDGPFNHSSITNNHL